MLSGRRLDLLEPSPLDIEIEDIAHGLARVARWNGQTKGAHAFSVAQHCVLVERLVGGPQAPADAGGPADGAAARRTGICLFKDLLSSPLSPLQSLPLYMLLKWFSSSLFPAHW